MALPLGLSAVANREARLFSLAAVRAREAFNRALATFETFSAVGAEVEAEHEREDAHTHLDAYCDSIRAAHKALGGT